MPSDLAAVENQLLRSLTDEGEGLRRREGPPPVVPDHALLRRIGGGSYGEVWLARNVVGTYRAVKVVYRDRFGSARPYEREFQGMQHYEPVSRRHEGLVDVLQIGRSEDDAFFYYVMELADDAAGGPPLAPPAADVQRALSRTGNRSSTITATSTPAAAGTPQVITPEEYKPRTLSSEIQRSGRLPAGECVQAFLTLTAALSTLHRCGLLHRDLKPSNIVIVGGMPKLADIGLVAEAGAEMTFVGTEGFIPPEGPGTAAADLFALGRMFYEAFTGLDRMQFPSIPASPANMAEVKAMLELSAVAEKACAADPKKRYQSAEEMLADLALLHSGRSVQRLRTVESRLRAARRFGLAAAGAALLAAGVVVFVQHQREQEEQSRTELAAALAEAKLQRAIAERVSARPGARFDVMALLKEAARIRPGDPELRSAAITALAQPDVRLRKVRTLDYVASGSVAWNADGSLFAFAQQDGALRLEREDGSVVARLTPSPSLLDRLLRKESAGLLPAGIGLSGRYVLTTGGDGTQLWDVAAGKAVWQLPAGAGTATLDPAEQFVLFTQKDGRCVQRDIATGAERTVFSITAWDPLKTAFSEIGGGRVVLAQSQGDRVVLVDLAKAAAVQEWPVPDKETLFGLSLSPDGHRVRVSTAEASVFVFDAREPERRVFSHKPAGAVLGGCFSADGEVFTSSGWEGVTRLHESATCRVLTTLPGWSYGLSMTSDGRRFLTVDAQTPTLHEYEFAGSVCRVRMEPPGRRGQGSPTFPVLNAGGTLLATGSWAGARILHTADGSLAASLPGQNPVRCVVFKADGNLLTGGFNGLKLWPAAPKNGSLQLTGEPRCLETTLLNMIHSDTAGRVIVSASNSHLTRSVDGGPFEPLTVPAGEPPVHPPGICMVSPDGRWIAACHAGRFRIWDARTGTLHWHAEHHWESQPVFSPDSTRIAGNDRTRVWAADIASKRLLWSTPQPEDARLHGAWSPDGRWLVMARGVDSLTAFNAATGEVWGRIQHPDARPISGAVFTPDNRQLIVTTATGIIQMWQLDQLRAGLQDCGLDFPLPDARR